MVRRTRIRVGDLSRFKIIGVVDGETVSVVEGPAIGDRPTVFRHLLGRHGGHGRLKQLLKTGQVVRIEGERCVRYGFREQVEWFVEHGEVLRIETPQGSRYVLSPKAEGRHD
jgi:hypothetical protein